jgi:hypothetical protein
MEDIFGNLMEEKSPEELREAALKQLGKKSARPMGYVYPQKIRELLATTDLSKPMFEAPSRPNIMVVPLLPKKCPNCGKSTKYHLDLKFIALRKRCFDCIIIQESEIRSAGLWEEYETWKMMENQLSWLKDVRDETEDFLEVGLKKVNEYVGEDGHREKWTNPNYEKDKIFIEDKLKEVIKAIETTETDIIPFREKFDYYEPLKKIKEKTNDTTVSAIS